MEPVAIGIDIGGTKLIAGAIAADGTILERVRHRTPRDGELLVSLVAELSRELGDLPVGIGIAGMVSHEGAIRYGPNLAFRDLPLQARISALTSQTVTVLNDGSAAALGEQRVGAARGHRDVLMLTLGTGVGGGVVIDDRLLVGREGFAGELGHIIIAEGGRRCPCGNRGCIEAYVSGTAMGEIANERLAVSSSPSALRELDTVDGRAVTQAAMAGDELAASVLEEVGSWLGVAVASLVNALDPGVTLVGGGAAIDSSPWLLPHARSAMGERIIGTAWRQPPSLELAALGDDAGMVGAGLLAGELHGSTARAVVDG